MSSRKREQHAGERRVPGAGKAAAARLAAFASRAAASPAAAGDAAAGLELAGEDALAAAAAAAAFWACRSLSRWIRAAARSRIVFSVGGDILDHEDISKTGLYYRVSSDSLQYAIRGGEEGAEVVSHRAGQKVDLK